jgi:hypothetical protein
VLPRSLRSVAGAPRTARKKRPATPVGMTEWGKSEAKPRGRGHLKVAATGRRGTQEGGASFAPAMDQRVRKESLDVEEPVVGVGGVAGLDGG